MAVNKPTKKATKTGKAIEVKFIPSDELISNRLYANYVQITHSPFDFTLRFCDAIPISDLKKVVENEGIHKIPLVAEIAIPLNLMPALIEALQTQHKNYKDGIEGKKNAGKSPKK